jgi:nitroimidazol reductase NimA-like FMN-containing flavoprotein (pyridoxamine 5'-phosphate oxidase superfamily)
MSLAMTQPEREAFLADLHVGVVSIDQPGAPPLSVPIWYDYAPATGLWIITGANSVKGQRLKDAGRFTLVAQTEAPPTYQYVSVEGPITETRDAELEKDLRPMAHRYFGAELGDAYVAGNSANGQLVFVMQPERWRTVDYRKMGAA